jgi:hypothetical protein
MGRFRDSSARAGAGGKPAGQPRPRPVSCRECGRTFSGPASYQVAHDGGRCLPDHVTESQLVPVDGVLHLRGAGG